MNFISFFSLWHFCDFTFLFSCPLTEKLLFIKKSTQKHSHTITKNTSRFKFHLFYSSIKNVDAAKTKKFILNSKKILILFYLFIFESKK